MPQKSKLTPTGKLNLFLALSAIVIVIFSINLTRHHGTLALFDVGQGDGMLFTTKQGMTVLIDGGPDAILLSRLGSYLPFLRRRIDLLVVSHPDLDHIASLPEVLRRYDVRAVLLPLIDKGQPRHLEMLAILREKKINVIGAQAGQEIALDDVTMHVLWPDMTNPVAHGRINDASVALKIHVAGLTILTTGDAEKGVEAALLQSGIDLKADVLKVGHHGSRTSTTDPFLNAVDPAIALISAGRDNRFGHPHTEVTDRLRARGTTIHQTNEEGTVVLTFPKTYTMRLNAGSAAARRPVQTLLAP